MALQQARSERSEASLQTHQILEKVVLLKIGLLLTPEAAITAAPLSSSFQSHTLHCNEATRFSSKAVMKRDNIAGDKSSTEVDFSHTVASIVRLTQLSDVGLQDVNISLLQNATVEPPVTRASLSELDLLRIVNDPKLRHDLNFEKDVSFRPNYDGERGKQKKSLAKKYWTALAFELALYMRKGGCESLTHYLEALCSENVPLRLPIMFKTVQDILKTLVRGEDVLSVDRVLDVELLMQQLKKGACDLIGLGEWLGVMLKGSCSPVRDGFVTSVVQQIRQAAFRVDPCALALAIEQLFGILETMKLDVANHQIRHIRLLMITNGVQHEQGYFLSQIENNGLDVAGAVQWFEASLPKRKNPARKSISPLLCLSNAIIDLVANTSQELPVTLNFDRDRISRFRIDFQQALFQAAVSSTFVHLLRRLAFTGSVDQSMLGKLHHRIHQLNPSLSLIATDRGFPSFPDSYSLILEITRTAYATCGSMLVPTTADLAFTWKHIAKLLDATDGENSPKTEDMDCSARPDMIANASPKECCAKTIKSMYRETLEALVQAELFSISSQAPLDIHSHYESSPGLSTNTQCPTVIKSRDIISCGKVAALSSSPIQEERLSDAEASAGGSEGLQELEASSECITRIQTLQALAQRIAHVSVLHWRVWGPIVYVSSAECADEITFDNERSSECLPEVKETDCHGQDVKANDQGPINHEEVKIISNEAH